jgi:hypothetical protein
MRAWKQVLQQSCVYIKRSLFNCSSKSISTQKRNSWAWYNKEALNTFRIMLEDVHLFARNLLIVSSRFQNWQLKYCTPLYFNSCKTYYLVRKNGYCCKQFLWSRENVFMHKVNITYFGECGIFLNGALENKVTQMIASLLKSLYSSS